MRISIGILAWNEAGGIEQMLQSLFLQDLLQTPDASIESIEVICVPNGCTDDTGAVAHRAIQTHRPPIASLTCRVCELTSPGKINAWNEFVHRLSDQLADFIILLDADVVLPKADTLSALVNGLAGTPEAYVSVPSVLKHTMVRDPKSWWERLSLYGAKSRVASRTGLAGCLYCGRGRILRQLWFPDGVIGDDALLSGLLVTDFLRTKELTGHRVKAVPEACVVFEAYTRPSDIWANNCRRAVIRGIDAILYSYLWANVSAQEDALAVMRRRNLEDPEWFRKLLAEEISRKGWWVMPEGVIWRRLRNLKRMPWMTRVALLPAALMGCALDLAVSWKANRILKGRKFAGVWKSKSHGRDPGTAAA